MTVILPVRLFPRVEIVNFVGQRDPSCLLSPVGWGQQTSVRSEGDDNPRAEVVVSDRSPMVPYSAQLKQLVVLNVSGLELAQFDGFL